MNKMLKGQNKTIAKGVIIGFVLGAMLPDNINPVELIKSKILKKTV